MGSGETSLALPWRAASAHRWTIHGSIQPFRRGPAVVVACHSGLSVTAVLYVVCLCAGYGRRERHKKKKRTEKENETKNEKSKMKNKKRRNNRRCCSLT